jgi:hypothetical protein
LRAGRAESRRNAKAAAIGAAGIMWVATTVSAHRLDECLQATRIAIEPDRIEIEVSLTPGVDVADAIIGDIDQDGDHVFSTREQQAFATRVLSSLDVTQDGHRVDVVGGPAAFPAVDAVRRGEGTIHLRSTAALGPQADGGHRVSFRNRYRPEMSVYLANALVPQSDRIAVTGQRRDTKQQDLTIDYVMRGGEPASKSTWLLSGLVVALAALMVRQGRP